MTKGEYFLGIDTGVSKSAAALSDGDGRLLGTVRGTGVTFFLDRSNKHRMRVLRDLISEVCQVAGIDKDRIGHVGAGMCGVDLPKQWEEQHRMLCDGLALNPDTTTLVNDAIVALWGATTAGRAAIVQQGSAFTSAYRVVVGEEELFDPFDYAGLFDIRREALARVARMLDGRLARTRFASLFLEHFGVSDAEGLNDVMADPGGAGRKTLSTVVGVISTAFEENDPVATELLESLATDLAVTIRAMAERMGPGPLEAALGGGVIERLPTRFFELLGTRLATLCPGAVVVGTTLPPEQGALVMAGHRAGLAPERLFAVLAEQSSSAGPARARLR